ncbi:MAG: phosphoketolase family protein [Candidatus Vogelbacteria bacterium]|nr:phosphoketolase family protein [Candidatus Vogelbacteria bacterium]
MNQEIESIKKYVRVANYLSAGQIYLQNNFDLARKLKFDDIKPRLLGHWGTCPGINFVYANLNCLIKRHEVEMIFVLGPGHGFPAVQANLFMEGTLGKYYPEATQDLKGLGYIMRNFSWPYGFPSHSNPGAPGVILEGGELGYALSTSYGAVLDNPNLIATCLVGDGEAETGPTATAWHLNKIIDPKTCGAVLPILHLNGYKISAPTLFGRMSNSDLRSLFRGYGYEPFIVEGKNVYEKMFDTVEKCYQSIKKIQSEARGGVDVKGASRFPMIILKTPKGWTGIKKLRGEKIEGNFLSHQVVGPNVKTDRVELSALNKWLASYKFEELFSAQTGFTAEIKTLIPSAGLRMGDSKYTMGGMIRHNLILPTAEQFSEDASIPGTIGSSSMRRAGEFLNEVFKLNNHNKNFRLMSPDETYSNKLDKVFETTARAFTLPKKEWDKDLRADGRVMEMLSEHSLQGLIQGYVLTGRHAVFASYEAFIQIVSSMVDQYSKFLKVARDTSFRGDISSLNYILTSSGWRQEHNGFSHQNPGFIANILLKHGCFVHVYFPPDGNSTLAVLEKCLASKNEINIIVAGKTLEPRWLTPEAAKKELKDGLAVWDFASNSNPDIVFSAAGDYLTKEALAAIYLLKEDAPEVRTRFVNIIELCSLGIRNIDCSAPINFGEYFTNDKPVIFNFHGYPETLKQALFDKVDGKRKLFIHGYVENGSTTTPFDMQVRNETSRYHLVKEAVVELSRLGVLGGEKAEAIIEKYDKKLTDHAVFIRERGVDPDEIENWKWTRNI